MCTLRRPLKSRGRREGRVQAAPMARQQIKKLAAVTTGLAEQPGLPCEMVLTVSFVLSLGTGLSCSHRQQDHLSPTWPQRREARTTRLRRPQERRSSARKNRTRRLASIAARLTSGDDWPSRLDQEGRDGRIRAYVSGKRKRNFFTSAGTRTSPLNQLAKFDRARPHFFRGNPRGPVATSARRANQ